MTNSANEPAEGAKTAAKQSVSGNPSEVVWPKDPFGVASALKAGGLASAERIRGHEDKYKVVMATLKVLAAHTKARYEKAAKQKLVVAEDLEKARLERDSRERNSGSGQAPDSE
jgi:hypothetical protein